MRKFIVLLTFGSESIAIHHWFVPELSYSIDAQDFLPLLSPCVDQKVSECGQEAQEYLLEAMGLEVIAPSDPLEFTVISVEEA